MISLEVDLVALATRLRGFEESDFYECPWTVHETCLEAAEAIATLQAENNRLSVALKEIDELCRYDTTEMFESEAFNRIADIAERFGDRTWSLNLLYVRMNHLSIPLLPHL